jgi:DHA2 family multidrug resistance protein
MASASFAAPPSDVAALPVDPARRAILMTLVIAATVMQVLDQTIANVALPHMQGALSAAPDTISWVLTSYIVASAVATPVTGWLSDTMGRRNLLIMTVAGFTAASALCAVSVSLPMMVAARLMQGAFGAFIIPAGQALLLDINPKSRHPQAMGPVLGGWLTDTFDWRWVFMINVPIGILALIGLLIFMPRVPATASRFDMSGFGMLFVAIGAFQLMLDRGQQNDWFESTETIIEAVSAATAGLAFIIHTLTSEEPLLPPTIFRDRNLVISCLFILMVVGLVMASSALIPQLLQSLMGYDAYGAGLVTMPRGVAMAASMIFGGRLAAIIDRRIIILFGMMLTAISMRMMMGASLDMSGHLIVISGIVQGFGFGCVFLPLNLMAFGTIDPRFRTQGAALYSLARSLSGSIAISLMSSLIARQMQISHSDLAGYIDSGASAMVSRMMGGGGAPGAMMTMMNGEVTRQATMIAYVDAFTVMFWFCILAAPLILFLRSAPTKPPTAEEAGHAMAME